MSASKQRKKEKGSLGTLKARKLEPEDSTHAFDFYLDEFASSHRRVMMDVEGGLEELLKKQSPKTKNGETIFKRPNGKLYTPLGKLTFQIRVMPSRDSPEEHVLRLLFRWIDLYFIAFGVKDVWYMFRDGDELVVPLPPVKPGVKAQVKEVPFNTSYGNLGTKEVLVGPRAIWRLYAALMDVESNFLKEADPKTRRDAFKSFQECQLSLPAVIFSESLRFLQLREWVSTRLEAGDVDETAGTAVPEEFTKYFTEWSTNSGPMFQENPRPHQKLFALLGILKRSTDTVVPYMDSLHMETVTSQCSKFAGKEKELLNLVVIGHINSGKSTTFGHLIHMRGCIDKCVMDRTMKEATEMNRTSCRYAWLFDKLKSERARGISIELSVRKLESEKYMWTVIDSPGHPDFIKNMIAGTCQADCSVLIIDSTSFKAGISTNGQTREHAFIARALGVKHIICCCNKMDATTPKYSKKRYEKVVKEVSACLKEVGYKPDDMHFVPISGLEGDNLIKSSVNMGWYKGLTLLKELDRVIVPQLPEDAVPMDQRPLRLPLRGKYKMGRVGTVSVGCVQSGILKPGMEVIFAPTSVGGDVRSVELHHESVQMAIQRDSVGFNTRQVAVKDLNRGYMVSNPKQCPAQGAASFQAHVRICFHHGKIRRGYTPVMHCHTSQTAVKFTDLVSKLDNSGRIVEENPEYLEDTEFGIVKMVPAQPVVLETYEQYPRLGRFVLRDLGRTVAYGVIMSVENKVTAEPERE